MKKLASIVLMGILAITFFTNQGCQKKEEDVIKFGAVLPQTGNLSQLGIPKQEAFLLAEDHINKKGGIEGKKIGIVFGDNQGEPKIGVSVFRKMHDIENVRIFYVDITRVANACIPIADQLQCILFAGSAHPAITEGSNWAFRVFTSGDQETTILAKYLSESNIESIFILHTDEVLGEYSRDYLTRKFINQGGKVLGAEAFKVGQSDCRSILLKARDSKAGKIVLIGYGVTFPIIIKQINELKIPHQKIVGNIGFVGPRVASIDPTLLEGMIFTGPTFSYRSSNPEDEKMRKFVDDYKNKYGENPDYTAAFAYDTIMIIKDVILSTGLDYNQIRQGLLRIKDYHGVSGKISFLPNGDTITDTELMTYSNRLVVPYKE